jgi:hypothetical protein
MKLLDTNASNTKIAKTVGKAGGKIRLASLSMMPTAKLCPASKAAGCFDACLKSAGRGRFDNVRDGRQRKTDFFNEQRLTFLDQLVKELRSFSKLCTKQGVQGVVRLNVLSDIAWEDYDIPQTFPELQFYDYTKRANRIGKTPANYRLMFSYSGREQYKTQVSIATTKRAPIAVVFNGTMPETFLGRKVIDGDQSDWDNVNAGAVVVGLKAKGQASKDQTGFVVHTGKIKLIGALPC